MDDVIVIGAGPIGAAAAHHASKRGMRVRIIGPTEAPRATHQVWSSHYDAGRLTHRSARNVPLALLALESIQRYRDIEHRSGIDFYTPCGTLSLSASLESFSYTRIRADLEAALGFRYDDFSANQLTSRFPMLASDLPYAGVYDGPPSGIINPRRMVAAHLVLAVQYGAQLERDIVTQVQTHSDMVAVHTSDGQTYKAARAIIAAGAYSGLSGLLPTPVEHTVKSETVTLAEVSAAQAEALHGMPSMMVDCQSDILSDAYLTPPVKYPDGKWYLKLGSNSTEDVFFSSAGQIRQWVTGDVPSATHTAQRALIQSLFRGIDWLGFQSVPCIITRTPSGVPEITKVHERVATMVGCNGSLAKSSDAVGRVLVDTLLA
ncbi:MAG: putative sarcosine oxidase [Chloroflexota bacterium]